jgi:hypothetical protein
MAIDQWTLQAGGSASSSDKQHYPRKPILMYTMPRCKETLRRLLSPTFDDLTIVSN